MVDWILTRSGTHLVENEQGPMTMTHFTHGLEVFRGGWRASRSGSDDWKLRRRCQGDEVTARDTR